MGFEIVPFQQQDPVPFEDDQSHRGDRLAIPEDFSPAVGESPSFGELLEQLSEFLRGGVRKDSAHEDASLVPVHEPPEIEAPIEPVETGLVAEPEPLFQAYQEPEELPAEDSGAGNGLVTQEPEEPWKRAELVTVSPEPLDFASGEPAVFADNPTVDNGSAGWELDHYGHEPPYGGDNAYLEPVLPHHENPWGSDVLEPAGVEPNGFETAHDFSQHDIMPYQEDQLPMQEHTEPDSDRLNGPAHGWEEEVAGFDSLQPEPDPYSMAPLEPTQDMFDSEALLPPTSLMAHEEFPQDPLASFKEEMLPQDPLVSSEQEGGLLTEREVEETDSLALEPAAFPTDEVENQQDEWLAGWEDSGELDDHKIRSQLPVHIPYKIIAPLIGAGLALAACSPEELQSLIFPEEEDATQPRTVEMVPTIEPSPTPEPFSLIEATPTAEVQSFIPPRNPPEYRSLAAGGAFPESIREVATNAKYIALEIQKREEEGPFLTTEERYYTDLDAFQTTRGYELIQSWNRKLGPNEFQMVTTLLRESGGVQQVRWFVTEGGAFMTRPDGLPQGADPKNPTQVWVPLPAGTLAVIEWGRDDNPYLFAVDDNAGEDVFWFDTTKANAFLEGGIDAAWELHPSVEELVASSSLQLSEFAFQGGRWIGLDATGQAVLEYDTERGEWSVVDLLPTTCLDPEVNQQVVAEYLASTPHNTLQEAIDEWKNSVEYVENNYARTSRAGLSTVTRANGEEFYRQMWYMSHNMKVVGGYRFSLANHPGFGQGDFGHCLLAASPHMGDILAPIVFGVEQNGVWSQTVFIRQSNNPLVVGKIIDLYGSEDADRWIDQMRGEVIHPLIVLRFDRLNWERDPSWHSGYDSVLPLLRNSSGYIMRYTNSPSELGPKITMKDGTPWGEKASLSRVITEMNLASGGDVGLFAWQISIEE